MSTQVDLFTNVEPTSVSPAIAKLPVGSSALLDWNEKVIRAKRDFAIAFAKWVSSPEHKKMIEDMKRLGAIR